MRAYYSEFANHCIRFFVAYPQPRFHTDADKKNWYACENALKSFNDADRATLLEVYKNGENALPDTVNSIARTQKIKPGAVWKLIEDFERKVAKKRGLL